jgi:hypothetical protein
MTDFFIIWQRVRYALIRGYADMPAKLQNFLYLVNALGRFLRDKLRGGVTVHPINRKRNRMPRLISEQQTQRGPQGQVRAVHAQTERTVIQRNQSIFVGRCLIAIVELAPYQ